jgi:MarR family transcriptional regulator, temperature-dependent positive regulator of motility
MNTLTRLPEMLFEIADRLKLKAPTEAGLAELPPSELELLRLVTLFPGCGISFLTDRTKMRQANVSGTVRSLGQRGLVRKVPGDKDRRAVRLYPTEQAARDLDALRQVWLGRLLSAFAAAGLAEPEQARLLADLEALLAAM